MRTIYMNERRLLRQHWRNEYVCVCVCICGFWICLHIEWQPMSFFAAPCFCVLFRFFSFSAQSLSVLDRGQFCSNNYACNIEFSAVLHAHAHIVNTLLIFTKYLHPIFVSSDLWHSFSIRFATFFCLCMHTRWPIVFDSVVMIWSSRSWSPSS